MTAPRIVLAGGSGFLGQELARFFGARGYDVAVLTRSPKAPVGGPAQVEWDGRTVGAWWRALDGATAVVNLAGKSVNCRYTPANRREIVESRVLSVRALGAALRRCAQPPVLWVQAGSLAIYGDAGERICDEGAPHGQGFSVEVCEQWEQAFHEATPPGVRPALLRVGFVLERSGGALGELARLARWGLGGAAGSGRQYISWLHAEDFNRMVAWCIERPGAVGTYNATGPSPATNAAFMRSLRRALGRPWSPPIPAPAVRLGAALMGTEGELALSGRRCVPQRLLDEGFAFRHPDLDVAFGTLYNKP